QLARRHGDEPWMVPAILTAVPGRGGALLGELLRSPTDLNKAEKLLEPLCTSIANRRNGPELSGSLVRGAGLGDARLQGACLRGFRASFRGTTSIAVTEIARAAVKKLALSSTVEVRTQAQALVTALKLESMAERQARLAGATRAVSNIKLS